MLGIGRGVFAYSDTPKDVLEIGQMDWAKCCATCSACVQLMRDGDKTGCVVRDGEVYSLRTDMTITARYVHTNLVAKDWERLARFYERAFGCVPVPPERDLSGQWLDDGVGIPNAHIRGIHLRLPGYGDEGPTLEVFQYEPMEKELPTAANRPGFGHIAFAVEDVESTREAVLAAGGGELGKVVSVKVAGAGRITFAYLTDPEGNIIEVQCWD
jgi:predicted enzyme related to lactoylglutathione lyase